MLLWVLTETSKMTFAHRISWTFQTTAGYLAPIDGATERLLRAEFGQPLTEMSVRFSAVCSRLS